MRKIKPASSPWRRAVISRVSLSVLLVVSRLLETQSRQRLAKTMPSLSNTDIFTLVLPILELVCVHLFMLTFLAGPRSLLTNLKLAVKNLPCNPVELVENLVVRLDVLMTSPTSIVLDTLKCS